MQQYKVVIQEHTRQTLIVEAESEEEVRKGNWIEIDSETVEVLEPGLVVESVKPIALENYARVDESYGAGYGSRRTVDASGITKEPV